MLKKLFTLFLLSVSILSSSAQMVYPSKWTFKVGETKNGETELIFNVKMDKGWHIYSQFTPDGGPLPMVFTFDPSGCYKLVGKVTEPKAIIEYDSTFMVETWLFHDQVTFRQKVKVNEASCKITGRIEYQVCLESCIFKDTAFTFNIGKIKSEITPAIKDTVSENNNPDTTTKAEIIPENNSDPGKPFKLEESCGVSSGDANNKDRSYIGIFLAGMIGGLLALLTPCVFPMIPMTVSFFTKRSGSKRKGIKNAFIYAASIILIYVTLGLLVTVMFGSDALNDMSSNAFFNLAFFIIFVIFAISFFGAFEIVLPSWIINKADSASDRGGLLGIFFMAFTLSLVSFSCTGPIIGTLLVEAAQGQSYIGPLAGMTGFSLALAIPFAIFSMFPEWLNSLPKSGGWLNTVKVSLGFIELALALKFLSNVDLAYHWGILQREIFICLWIVIAAMWGMYLIGKIRLSHDTETSHISPMRLIIALLVFTFALYLIPGIWGAPLKLISGFPPPEFYKEWKTGHENECPHDLNCFHDYEEGVKYAKAQGKPIIIDFTGWSCVNCRKMEDKVWSDPAVLKRLSQEYVLISLYVDDKTALPKEEQVVSPSSGKMIKTIGNKWSDLQASVYSTNTQPYYVLIDNKEKILAEPRGGIIGIKDYVSYLDEGLCRYKMRKQQASLIGQLAN